MSDKPLNKREKRFLQPAIVYGWKIEIWPSRKTPMWDGDPLFPVRLGPMFDSLLEREYLEKCFLGFRGTEKALAYKCRSCQGHGRLYDDNGIETGKCPDCENGVTIKAVKS